MGVDCGMIKQLQLYCGGRGCGWGDGGVALVLESPAKKGSLSHQHQGTCCKSGLHCDCLHWQFTTACQEEEEEEEDDNCPCFCLWVSLAI